MTNLSHGGTHQPIEKFSDDDYFWVVTCTCCDRMYANVRLSLARSRWDDAHNVEHFVDPASRPLDLND